MRELAFIGDTHNIHVTRQVLQGSPLVTTNFVHVGDFGLSNDLKTNGMLLNELEETLLKFDSYLYVVRGNHDNPSYFNGGVNQHKSKRTRIIFINDYEVLDLEGVKILCIGGAISVDRKVRQAKNLNWWEDEKFVFDANKMESLIDVKPNIVVTHSAPSHFPPNGVNQFVLDYAEYDDKLLTDLETERNELLSVFDLIDKSEMHEWIYGHFHKSNSFIVEGSKTRCLTINEVYCPYYV